MSSEATLDFEQAAIRSVAGTPFGLPTHPFTQQQLDRWKQDATEIMAERVNASQLKCFVSPTPMETTIGVAPQPDMVNHPPHYTAGGIECIDAIHAALGDEGFVAYCRGAAIKYSWRTGLKGDATEDLRKAEWYARRAAEVQAKLGG